MHKTTWRVVLLVLLLTGSIEARSRVRLPPPPPQPDIFSNANANDVRTEHLTLDLTVDFDAERIRGSATHEIVNVTGVNQMILDTRGLTIQSVTADGAPAQWSLGADSRNGQALTIAITTRTREVRITYQTGASAGALRWMEATQTLGRVSPALVVQGQPDLARSWIPIQDTPAARMTWDATVRVPQGMLALMSGRNPQEVKPDGLYTFEQRRTVPPYLIVLAVGRLEFRALGDRTGVYAEPELIEDAAHEMQHVPQMLEIAEDILGPYPFDRYDLLFAPKFGGGMENVELNFIGPESITRNRPDPVIPSSLIAHELAHSWVGDMVTCSTWGDLWLNEGFATYYDKRIMERIQSEERAELGFWFDRNAYANYASTPSVPARLQALHRIFAGTEGPGSPFNVVSYQKGALFIKMLEDRIGRTRFDSIMDEYLRKYAFRWVDDRAFIAEIEQGLAGEPSLLQSLRIQQWVYEGGLPENVTAPTTARMWERVRVQSLAFRAGTPLSQIDRSGWTSFEEILFIQQIADLVEANIAQLDEVFGYAERISPPTLWLVAIAKTKNPTYLPLVEDYLGRGENNSLPIWYEFSLTNSGRFYALPIYQRVKQYYSDNNRQTIEAYLRISEKSAEPMELEGLKHAA